MNFWPPQFITSHVTQTLSSGSASLKSVVVVINSKCTEAVSYCFNVTFRTKSHIFIQGPTFKRVNEKWQFNSERCWR